MVILTKINDANVLVNLDAIKYIEKTPDTVIQFINGDSMIIKESLEQIDQLVIAHRAKIFATAKEMGTTPAKDSDGSSVSTST